LDHLGPKENLEAKAILEPMAWQEKARKAKRVDLDNPDHRDQAVQLAKVAAVGERQDLKARLVHRVLQALMDNLARLEHQVTMERPDLTAVTARVLKAAAVPNRVALPHNQVPLIQLQRLVVPALLQRLQAAPVLLQQAAVHLQRPEALVPKHTLQRDRIWNFHFVIPVLHRRQCIVTRPCMTLVSKLTIQMHPVF